MTNYRNNKLNKILSSVSAMLMVFTLIAPAIPVQAQELLVEEPVVEQKEKEVLTSRIMDWAGIDWDSDITLLSSLIPQDLGLETEKFTAEELEHPRYPMTSDKVLAYYDAPEEVRKLVVQYREEVEKLTTSPIDRKAKQAALVLLQRELARMYGPAEIVEPVNEINLLEQPRLNITRLIPEDTKVIKPEVSVKKHIKAKKPALYDTTTKALKEKNLRGVEEVQVETPSLKEKLLQSITMLFRAETVNAHHDNPLIEEYDGIEELPVDHALLYIANAQDHDDWSYGNLRPYEETFETLLLMSNISRTDNQHFTLGLEYLTDTEPQNNRERSMKARILAAQGQNVEALLDQVLATQDPQSGAISFGDGTGPDVLTTMEAALAMLAADYGIQEHLPGAISYILAKIENDGAMRFTPGSNPSFYLINNTAQSLLPFTGMSVGDEQNRVHVNDKIVNLLSWLTLNTNDDGSLVGSDLAIDTAMTLTTFRMYGVNENKRSALASELREFQFVDGSFDGELLPTIESVYALRQADLRVTGLQLAGAFTQGQQVSFDITIENSGYLATSPSTTLRMFFDNVNLGTEEEFGDKGWSIDPGDTLTLRVNIAETGSFVGDLNVKVLLTQPNDPTPENNWGEGVFAVEEDAAHVPATQLYYMASKYTIGGDAGFNVRWQVKADDDRENYVVMFRPQGEQEWRYAGISTEWNGAFLRGGIAPDTWYEVTAGVLHRDRETVTFKNNFTLVHTDDDDDTYLGSAVGTAYLDGQPAPNMYVWGYGVSDTTDENGRFEFSGEQNGSSAAWANSDEYEHITTAFTVPEAATSTGAKIFTKLKEDNEAPTIDAVQLRWANNDIARNQNDYTILAFGNDNIGVAEADIHYYDPHQDAWILLTSGDVGGNNQFDHEWTIPAELLGEGYFIRAVFRDYRGNESEPAQYGPFEIIDGTPPDVTVVSPNGGEVWPLGTTQEIRWTVDSVNPIENIRMYRDYNGVQDNIGGNIANNGSYNWDIPVNAWYAGDEVRIKVRAEDPVNWGDGEDYSDEVFQIADQSASPDRPWARPFQVSNEAEHEFSSCSARDVKVAFDDVTGLVHVVYYCGNDVNVDGQRIITDQYYEAVGELDGNDWSDPVLFYEKETVTDANLNGYVTFSDLELFAHDSKFHLVWQHNPAGGCEAFNGQEIYSLSNDGQGWGEPVNLLDNDSPSRSLDATIAPNGNLHVVWRDGGAWDAECNYEGQSQLHYKERVNGNWQPHQVLVPGQSTGDPAIAASADDVHVLYRQNADISWQAMTRNGGWVNPEQVYVSADGTGITQPELTLSPAGTFHFVFRNYFQDPNNNDQWRSRMMYTRSSDEGWLPAVEVSLGDPGEDSVYPHIMAGEDDRPHVMYQQYFGEGNQRHPVWRTQDEDGNWLDPQAVDLVSQYIQNGTLRADLHDGKIVAAWGAGFSRRTHIFANVADLSLDFIAPPAVEGLAVAGVPGGSELTWNQYDRANDVNELRIYRANNDGGQPGANIQMLDNLVQARTHYIDLEDQDINMSFFYAVKAADEAGNVLVPFDWVGPVTSTAPITNLVTDGRMEDPDRNTFARWGVPQEWDKTTDDAYSGHLSMYVNAIDGHAGIQRAGVPVEAGQSYKLSFRTKGEGTVHAGLGIRTSNGDFEGKNEVVVGDGTWQYYERLFTVPDDFENDFRLRVSVRRGEAFIDDIVIQEIGEIPIVLDGNMEENGSDKWRAWGGTNTWSKVTSTTHAGNNAMMLDARDGGSGFYQTNLDLEVGKNYTLAFWYKVDSGQLYNIIGMKNANADFEGLKPVFGSTDGEWRLFERSFTVTEENFRAPALIRFSAKNGVSYVDDVSIVEIDEIPLVQDGGLESASLDHWKAWGGSNNWSKVANVNHTGNNSMMLGAAGGGFYQTNIPVEVGKDYKISFWYRVDQGGTLFNILGMRSANADFEGVRPSFGDTQGQWVLYEREFSVTDENYQAPFLIRFSNKNAAAYVDDIAIEEIESRSLFLDGDMEMVGTDNYGAWGGSENWSKTSDEAHGGTQSMVLAEPRGGFYQRNLPLEIGNTYRLSFWYKVNDGAFRYVIGMRTANADFEGAGGNFGSTNGEWVQLVREFEVTAETYNTPVYIRMSSKEGTSYVDDVVLEQI